MPTLLAPGPALGLTTSKEMQISEAFPCFLQEKPELRKVRHLAPRHTAASELGLSNSHLVGWINSCQAGQGEQLTAPMCPGPSNSTASPRPPQGPGPSKGRSGPRLPGPTLGHGYLPKRGGRSLREGLGTRQMSLGNILNEAISQTYRK